MGNGEDPSEHEHAVHIFICTISNDTFQDSRIHGTNRSMCATKFKNWPRWVVLCPPRKNEVNVVVAPSSRPTYRSSWSTSSAAASGAPMITLRGDPRERTRSTCLANVLRTRHISIRTFSFELRIQNSINHANLYGINFRKIQKQI